MKTDEKKEPVEEKPHPLMTPEEAEEVRGGCILGKVHWDYKSDTFALIPKEAKAGDFVMLSSPELELECVEVVRVMEIAKDKRDSLEYLSSFDRAVRIASDKDVTAMKENKKYAEIIAKFTQKQSDIDNLKMKVLGAYLSFDRHKVLLEYTSDGRVDFRNLLKVLASQFHIRIEFRQLFSRDVAKKIGGLGACGLPICCSTFLTTFTSTTINMAKNQYLSLNIPKLSGVCGRLMCCLAYENEAYSQLKPLYPKMGAVATIDGKAFKVINLNVLSDSITATDGDTYVSLTSAEWRKVASANISVANKINGEQAK